MLKLISNQGQLDTHVSAEQLSLLCQMQPRIDSALWGKTPYMRRRRFRPLAGSLTGPRPSAFAMRSSRHGRRFVICIDEGASGDNAWPVTTAVALDLQESFGVHVASFQNFDDQSKAVLTVIASVQQMEEIQRAYPQKISVLSADASRVTA